MKNTIICFTLGAGALFASAATAAPLSGSAMMAPESAVQNVRMVCDEYGRCYRTRGSRRVVIQQEYGNSYGYAPRDRYIERRGYYGGGGGYYNDGPSVGIGVGPGGVGVGVGVGPRW